MPTPSTALATANLVSLGESNSEDMITSLVSSSSSSTRIRKRNGSQTPTPPTRKRIYTKSPSRSQSSLSASTPRTFGPPRAIRTMLGMASLRTTRCRRLANRTPSTLLFLRRPREELR